MVKGRESSGTRARARSASWRHLLVVGVTAGFMMTPVAAAVAESGPAAAAPASPAPATSPPTANAGVPQTVGEGSTVTLSSAGSAPDTSGDGPLSYSWAVTASTGPSVSLSDADAPSPVFVAPATGSYSFSLTVTEASGQSASATTSVTVSPVAPANLRVSAAAATVGGPTLLTGSFTDPLAGDQPTATVDWGDDSTSSAKVQMSSGTGTVVAAHTYASPGSYTPTVTVTSTEGAGATARTAAPAQVDPPVGLWATATSGNGIIASGASGAIGGLVRSNSNITIDGSKHTFSGSVQYAGTLTENGSADAYASPPAQVPAAPATVAFALADYRPGGTAALAAGPSFHDETSACAAGGGTWTLAGSTTFSPGIYYAPCAVAISGSSVTGDVTLVATGDVDVSGSGATFTPFVDGLSIASSAVDAAAVRIDGASAAIGGYLYAPAGAVVLAGAKDQLACGAVAGSITLAGAGLTVGPGCEPFATAPLLDAVAPGLTSTLSVNAGDATPGDTLTYTSVLTNSGTTAAVGGIAGSTNTGTAPASVTGYQVALEYWSGSAWVTLGSASASTGSGATSTPGFGAVFSPAGGTGAAYPSSGDPVLGAQAAPGASVAWGVGVTEALTPGQFATLSAAAGPVVRLVTALSFGAGASTVPLPAPGDNLGPVLQASSGALTNAGVTFAGPAGLTSVTSATLPALASIAPGASVTVTAPAGVPVPAPKGSAESDATYAARLKALDGHGLVGQALVTATAPAGPLTAEPAPVNTNEHVPYLGITLRGSQTVEAGQSATYQIGLSDPSSAPASGLTVVDTFSGSPAAVSQAPAAIAAGGSGSATATYAVPMTQAPGDTPDVASVSWEDANGNHYGTLSATTTTTVTAGILAGAHLSLSVSPTGTEPTGTTRTLTAVLDSSSGSPLAGEVVTLTVTGANAETDSATTGSDGTATFTVIGNFAGDDQATATAGPTGSPVRSGSVAYSWLTLSSPVAITGVEGNFYAESGPQSSFVATPASTPAFGEQFPEIDFNPPAKLLASNSTGVNPTTAPFTDVVTDGKGNGTGAIPAEGNGHQAGIGSMASFDAVFRSAIAVDQPGDVTLQVTADAGWIMGAGNGAVRVSGALENPPGSLTTPFYDYPVVGSYDEPVSETNPQLVTLHFLSAGVFPIEIDYFASAGNHQSLVLSAVSSVATTNPVSVYVGYADGLRPGGSIFPFPWLGAPNTVSVGCQGGCLYDGGGVRVDNNSPSPVTIDHLAVSFGPNCTFQIWPDNKTLPSGEIAVFGQMVSGASSGCPNDGTFDTSDAPDIQCNKDGIIPQITLTVDGVTTTYQDSGQVLNTGGFDLACFGNESHPWTLIGGSASTIGVVAPPAFNLDLGPASTSATTGTSVTESVTATDNAGQPLAGVPVVVDVVGPSSRTVDATTGADGVATFSYTGAQAGTDKVHATAFVEGLGAESNEVSVDWAAPAPPPPPPGAPVPSVGTLSTPGGTAAGGTTVTLTGSGFTGASAVYFGTIPAASFAVVNDGTITAVSPPAPSQTVNTTTSIVVIGPGGISVPAGADQWTWNAVPVSLPGAPAVSSVSPASGPAAAGTSVTINGSGFSGASAVYFGTIPAVAFTVVSDSRITATAPASPYPTENVLTGVTVVGPGGSSAPVTADQFEWTPPPAAPGPGAPVVTGVSPSTGPSSGGTVITVSGSGMTGATQVYFGSTPAASWTVDSDGSVTAVSPPSPSSAAQVTGDVTVLGPGGLSATIPADQFVWQPAPAAPQPNAPSVSGVSPSALAASGGTTVTITGSGFSGATAVFFGNLAALSFTVVNGTTISAVVPPAPSTSVTTITSVTVVTAGGASAAAAGAGFTWEACSMGGSPPTCQVAGGGPVVAPAPPTIGSVSLPDGATITAPTPITASIAAPAGASIAGWSVTVQSASGGPQTTVASGSGAPPSPIATLDPTLLDDGTYNLDVVATTNQGATLSETQTVVIDGALKPGRVVQSYTDLTVPVGGQPITVGRTYDSYDKSSGDFGYGWSLELSGFHVTTNGPLGEGGWTEHDVNCFFSICTTAFSSSQPHEVTVDWPDGHQEVFDFAPTGGSSLFPFESGAAYTAHPGTDTTSTLTPADPADASGLTFWNDGNLYDDFGVDPYDPTEFVLTATNGTSYLLSTTQGLISETDPTGNTTTIGPNGIISSIGVSVPFVRDAYGRVTQIDNPAGGAFKYSYSAAGDLAGVTNPDGATTGFTYDSSHDLISTLGPNGRPQQTLSYDSAGRLASITDAAGNVIPITDDVGNRTVSYTDPATGATDVQTYDARGDLTSISTISGGKTEKRTYTYDPLGRLLTRTDPAGDTWTGTYDAAGHLTSLTDPTGATTAYTYNSLGEPLTETNPDGGLTTYAYNSIGELVTETDPLGDKTSYTYTGSGQVASETSPTGGVTTYAYDGAGHEISTTNPDGATTSMTYDASGHLLTSTDPTGATTTYTYDPMGNVLTQTNPNGSKTTNTYDALGHLATTTDALGQVTTYTYDALGDVASATDTGGGVTTYTYDADHHLLTATDPLGHTTRYTYDGFENLASITDPDGRTQTATYDLANRVTSETGPSGATTTYGYDGMSRVTSVTTPNGATTTAAYDPSGLRTSLTDALGGTVLYTYDADGRMTSRTDPNGRITTDTYDGSGNLLSTSNPATGTTTDSYDPAGLVTSQTNGDGETLTYGYDQAGRTTSVSGPGVARSYTYNADGSVASGTDPSGTTSYTYDPLGRLATEHSPQGDLAYTYDALGDESSLSLPGGAIVSYGYDADGHLTSLTDPSSGVFQLSYDPAGQLTGETMPNGVSQTLAYTPSGQLASDTYATGGSTDAAFSYTYDANGNRTSETSGGATTTYSFDSLGRLTKAVQPSGTTSYAYDPAGNLTSVNGPQGSVSYGYDSAGRLSSAGSTSYSYDAAGNMISAGTSTFGYDALGNMTSSTVGGLGTSYAYNAFGLRSASATGATTTSTLWDNNVAGPAAVPVRNGGSNIVWAAGVPVEQSAAGGSQYLLTDGLDSVRAVTGASGTVTGTTSYSPYGAVTSASGTQSALGYTGALTDPSGLVYLQARYYDPLVGQFTTPDTVFPNAPATQGFDLYAYTGGNPVTFVDPTGHEDLVEESVAEGISADLASIAEESLAAEVDTVVEDVAVDITELDGECAEAGADLQGLNLLLKYKDGWSEAQIAAADAKVAALDAAAQNGQLAVTQSVRGGTSAAQMFRNAGLQIPPGSDIDHILDLQLGGANNLSNLSPLDASVNRSLGAQVANQIKGQAPGTPVDSVSIC